MVVCTECGADLDHFQHESDCPRVNLQVSKRVEEIVKSAHFEKVTVVPTVHVRLCVI